VFVSEVTDSLWVSAGLNNINVRSLVFKGTILLAGTQNGLYITSDNGNKWEFTDRGFTNTNITSFTLKGSGILVGTGSGLFFSDNNGESWSFYGLAYKPVSTVIVNGNSVVAGTFGVGIFASFDDGKTWTQPLYGKISVQSIIAVGHILAIATLGDGVYISKDNGKSWNQINSGLTDLNVISLTFNDNYLFAGTYGMGVWKYPLAKLPVNNQ
jgi:photosystem II stability/assembly factor-like uncharacterized protein